jgi:Mg-chelatase subunit ChlD
LFGWGKSQPASTATATAVVEKKRSIVLFITDGDNNDKDRTREVLRASEQRGDGVYFLFIGVSNQGSTFPFLESIGDEFGNTGLVTIKDLKAFLNQSDDDMNRTLLGDELMGWLKK